MTKAAALDLHGQLAEKEGVQILEEISESQPPCLWLEAQLPLQNLRNMIVTRGLPAGQKLVYISVLVPAQVSLSSLAIPFLICTGTCTWRRV